MDQDIFEYTDYKQFIKNKVRSLKKNNHSLTLQKISDQISIQYTYLSKVLNHDSHHLSDDHLYLIAQILKLNPSEIDFLTLLKDFTISQSSLRKKFLADKIDSIRKEKKLNIKVQITDQNIIAKETDYLFDPLCLLVYVALSSTYLNQKSFNLPLALGITQKKYRQILLVLQQNEMIELGNGQEAKKILKGKFHIGRNHPLMRVHQNIMKSTLQNKLLQTDEDDKFSFMATFTSDSEGFKLVQNEFQNFLKKVEKICTRSDKPSFHRNLFQLNFDLLKWI
ncbi:MAG: hypothetical protein WA160_05865 [Pseudobdellovibrio sp.]